MNNNSDGIFVKKNQNTGKSMFWVFHKIRSELLFTLNPLHTFSVNSHSETYCFGFTSYNTNKTTNVRLETMTLLNQPSAHVVQLKQTVNLFILFEVVYV